MASIMENARQYEPKKTQNVADLNRVNLSWELKKNTGKDKEGKEFEYNFFELNGIEYRVPNQVLEKIQEAQKIKDDIQYVNVIKQGAGLGTRYSIEVLNE